MLTEIGGDPRGYGRVRVVEAGGGHGVWSERLSRVVAVGAEAECERYVGGEHYLEVLMADCLDEEEMGHHLENPPKESSREG